jgi:hypothetical protein
MRFLKDFGLILGLLSIIALSSAQGAEEVKVLECMSRPKNIYYATPLNEVSKTYLTHFQIDECKIVSMKAKTWTIALERSRRLHEKVRHQAGVLPILNP